MAFARKLNRHVPVAAVIAFLCLSPASMARDETVDPMPEEVFQDQIGIEVVNIDVVVTDKKGRPVEGLTREDFVLRVEGREVEIANFYAVAGGREDVAPPPGPEPESAWEKAAAPAPREPLHLIVYFDSFYLTPISRKRVLEDLPDFFEQQIAAGARIMLIARDQSARVLSPFTTDFDRLQAALTELADAPSVGIQQLTARRSTFDSIRSIYQQCDETPLLDPCVDCFEYMLETIRAYSLAVLADRRAGMAALEDIVNALSVLEGRKSLLHVSDGIQQQSGIDLFHYLGKQLCPERDRDLQRFYLQLDTYDLDDLVALANASRVTFYALEGAGVRNFSSASAEYADHFFTPSPTNDMIRIANLQGTLHYISSETGGKPILNTTEYAADLARLADEFRTYYSLGYQPEHPGRGRSHRVSVKVPKKNYQVRYRRTFMHKKPDQQLADRALGAVFFGAAANPLAATVEVQATSAGEEGRVVVPLEISVPLAKLVLLPDQDTRRGRMMVIVAAPDEKNDEIAIRRKDIPVSLPLAATPGDDDVYRFGVNIELVPGTYRLGVGIWDEVAAAGSFLNVPVEARMPSAGAGATTE